MIMQGCNHMIVYDYIYNRVKGGIFEKKVKRKLGTGVEKFEILCSSVQVVVTTNNDVKQWPVMG